MKYRRTVKEQQNDDQIEYSRIVKETVDVAARRRFRRPAYDIRLCHEGSRKDSR